MSTSFDLDPQVRAALVTYLQALGDDRLVLGHRNSEWCGHGPILEEDLALTNIALDLVGQAQAFLALAGEIEGKGRNEDALAYFRDEMEFRNVQLVELPRGDFGFTIARQFLFDTFGALLMDSLQKCTFAPLAAIAAKTLREDLYHARHTGDWMRRLGDGTEESHRRVQSALDELWCYTGELFFDDPAATAVSNLFGAPLPSSLRAAWRQSIERVLGEATLKVPADGYMMNGSRTGRHSEHLGHLLAEMQSLARSHPGASW